MDAYSGHDFCHCQPAITKYCWHVVKCVIHLKMEPRPTAYQRRSTGWLKSSHFSRPAEGCFIQGSVWRNRPGLCPSTAVYWELNRLNKWVGPRWGTECIIELHASEGGNEITHWCFWQTFASCMIFNGCFLLLLTTLFYLQNLPAHFLLHLFRFLTRR